MRSRLERPNGNYDVCFMGKHPMKQTCGVLSLIIMSAGAYDTCFFEVVNKDNCGCGTIKYYFSFPTSKCHA